MAGVLFGFGVIVALGGYMIYRVDGLKAQAQISINQMLENQNALLKESGFSLSFDPFKCDGFIFVECKNDKIELLEKNGNVLAVFANPILSVDDFDTKGLTLSYFSDFDFLQKGDLEAYFQVLMPQKLKAKMKITLESEKSFFLDTHYELKANHLIYYIDMNQRIISQKLKQYGLLEYIRQSNFDGDVMLGESRLELKSEDLSQALFETLKKQYGGNLDFASYQGLVALMAGLSMEQFSNFKSAKDFIGGIKELVLGEKQKLIASFKPNDEICLNCNPMILENVIKEGEMSIETFK